MNFQVELPGVNKTMSEAALAASVAPSTAIPISAFLRAGASLTPSPVTCQSGNSGNFGNLSFQSNDLASGVDRQCKTCA